MVDSRPIGVFDSGFGGVNVLAAAVQKLPEEDFIFLGDNLHAPYGDRTPEEVLHYTRESVLQLMDMGCKAIVIACNTATSAAATALRKELALPIIGMEPALKPAALLPRNGSVLVMATAMTLALDKFHKLMDLYGQNAIPVPCPGLVELIEAGETDGPRIQAKLSELLSPHLNRPVKAVVLGCTHYIFLKHALERFLPRGVALVDGNEGTARELQKQLTLRGLLRSPESARMAACAADKSSVTPGREPTFLSTSPQEVILARMREWFALALLEAGTACNSTGDTVE